nr:putative F-box protein At3g25750 [Ipomoea batatas]
MAPRKKKDLLPSKQGLCSEQWPNLPQQLLNFIGRKPHLKLIQNVGSAGVTKSWKIGANRCNVPSFKAPLLELYHADHQCHDKYTLSISFYQGFYQWWWRSRGPPKESWDQFLGCSHGLILSPCCFLDPTKAFLSKTWFPSWDAQVPIRSATLSSFPMDPNGCNVMAITGCASPAFAVSRIECFTEKRWCYFKALEWSKKDITLIDPNDSEQQLMNFTNVVGYSGKFYALTLQGTLAVIEEVNNSQFHITKLCRRRAVPSVPSKRFTEYLLESSGEILLVFLICRKSVMSVDHVEALKLQLGDELSWIKMESLGDRTLFAGINSCMFVTASQVGCRRNSIYFTHSSMDSWRLYDMETDRILPCYDYNGSELKSPKWEEPTDGQ